MSLHYEQQDRKKLDPWICEVRWFRRIGCEHYHNIVLIKKKRFIYLKDKWQTKREWHIQRDRSPFIQPLLLTAATRRSGPGWSQKMRAPTRSATLVREPKYLCHLCCLLRHISRKLAWTRSSQNLNPHFHKGCPFKGSLTYWTIIFAIKSLFGKISDSKFKCLLEWILSDLERLKYCF